jgi:O-antigen/teichoic acid export membrane protein
MNSSVRYHVAWSMVSIVARNGCLVITYLFLARLLDPAGFGLIAVTMVGMGLANSFIDSGFTNVVIRQQTMDRNALSSLYWFNLFIGSGAALLLTSAGWGVAAIYHDHRLVGLMSTAGVALFCGALGQQFIAILQRRLAFRTLAGIETMSAASAMAVALLRAFSGIGPVAYFEGLAVGNALAALLAIIAARHDFFPKFRYSPDELRSVLHFGVFNTLERCINYLSFNLEKPVMGRLFSLDILGLYSVVNQLVTRPVMFFSGAFSRVAYPVYANLQKEYASLNMLYIAFTGKLALSVFPIYGFLILFDQTIIPLLFGNRFAAAHALVMPLCILGAFWSIGNPFGSYLMALNKAKIGCIFNACSAALVLTVFMIGSRFSLHAMLWIWVCAVAGFLIPAEWYLRFRLTGMSPRRYAASFLPHAIAVFVLCGAVFALRALGCYAHTPFSTAIEMALSSMIYGIYGFVIYRRETTKKEGQR